MANGVGFLTALQTLPYDLVEATERIRDQNLAVLDRAVPVIAMTANVQQADRQRCPDAGMNGFVIKPVAVEELRAALQAWLPARLQGSAGGPPIFDREAFLDRMM